MAPKPTDPLLAFRRQLERIMHTSRSLTVLLENAVQSIDGEVGERIRAISLEAPHVPATRPARSRVPSVPSAPPPAAPAPPTPLAPQVRIGPDGCKWCDGFVQGGAYVHSERCKRRDLGKQGDAVLTAAIALSTHTDPELLGHAVGPVELAIVSGYSVTSGAFQAAIRGLRDRGLLEHAGRDLYATEEGRAWMLGDRGDRGIVPVLPTGPALRTLWRTNLRTQASRIFDAVYLGHVHDASHSIDVARIAEETGYSVTSGAFQASIRLLKRLGLVRPLHNGRLTLHAILARRSRRADEGNHDG